jgi:ParB-like chromosome segregation protein Spo0J
MITPKSYGLGHSINQMDYLYHVAERLGPFVSGVLFTKTDLGESFSFWTFRHPVLTPYFKDFYSQGKHKKYIEYDAIKELGPEALAYWYMDDGKRQDYSACLCTGSVTRTEADMLVDVLSTNLGLRTTVQTHDAKRGYLNIYIPAETRETFFTIIRPFIIPSMQYKLTGDPYPRTTYNAADVAKRHEAMCAVVERPVNFSGHKETEKLLLSQDQIGPKQDYMNRICEAVKNGEQISHTNVRTPPTGYELKQMLAEGMTDTQIAQKYGFGRNRISKLRRDLGVPRKMCRTQPVRFPCMNTRLVPADKVVANEYNPNKVAEPEMELLFHSIEEDGLTQPIVTFHDKEQDKYIVVDGFHRYSVLVDHFKCRRIPVVVIDKPINDRMASTIRHNRARGKHVVDLMGTLVTKLYTQGWSDEQIAKHLGMQGEEILRLRQQVGAARVLAGEEFNKGWEMIDGRKSTSD